MGKIKLNRNEVGFEGIDWIILAQGEHQLRGPLNKAIINLGVL
jgi:hypothetical protein